MESRMIRRKKNKLTGCLLGILALFCLIPMTGYAKTEQRSIQVIERNNVTGEPIAGIELSIYQIAGFSEGDYGTLQYKEAFAGKSEEISALIREKKTKEAADLLENVIQKDEVLAQENKVSDADGTVYFTDLEDGIYLILCTGSRSEAFTFAQKPVLISVPGHADEGKILYQVLCEPKNEIIYPDLEQKVSVIKLWKDNNDRADKRPEKITVGLYENDILKEKVILSEKNNWSYEWEHLSENARYVVAELDIPAGYKMSVSSTGSEFTIVNTYSPSESTKTVKTGDMNQPGMWLAGIVGAGSVIAVFCIRCRKRQ